MALTIKSAIDDPDRFRSLSDVGPWAGLTPRREQSGERDILGAISRAGDAGLRTALYQAATVMPNRARPSWLTEWAWTIAKRRGTRRAPVALARRIGVILHRMWRDGTEFRVKRAEAMTAAAYRWQKREARPSIIHYSSPGRCPGQFGAFTATMIGYLRAEGPSRRHHAQP